MKTQTDRDYSGLWEQIREDAEERASAKHRKEEELNKAREIVQGLQNNFDSSGHIQREIDFLNSKIRPLGLPGLSLGVSSLVEELDVVFELVAGEKLLATARLVYSQDEKRLSHWRPDMDVKVMSCSQLDNYIRQWLSEQVVIFYENHRVLI